MQKKTSLERASARKYPEPVVLVTTYDPKRKKPNVMTVGWIANVSYEPRMLMVAIDDEAYTYELIRKTEQFVVALPSEAMARATLTAGSCHGHNIDKLAKCRLATQPASKVKAPLIRDAVVNFECKLVKILRPGDCPLLIGKVVAAHENKNPKMKRLYYWWKKRFVLRGVRSAR
jgi:flavin reductase (DIM6/NTAB) family NADH-FMN oxidoreductase RutF